MDRWLANHYPHINLIVGGHSHDLIEHGEKVVHTWITQTGIWGNYVGDIHVELEDHHVIKEIPRTISTTSMLEEPEDKTVNQDYYVEDKRLSSERQVVNLA